MTVRILPRLVHVIRPCAGAGTDIVDSIARPGRDFERTHFSQLFAIKATLCISFLHVALKKLCTRGHNMVAITCTQHEGLNSRRIPMKQIFRSISFPHLEAKYGQRKPSDAVLTRRLTW